MLRARAVLSIAVALALAGPVAHAAQVRVPALDGARLTVRLVYAGDTARQVMGFAADEWATAYTNLSLDTAQTLTLPATADIAADAATCYRFTVRASGARGYERCVQIADSAEVQELATLDGAATIAPGSVLAERLPPDPSAAADGLLVGTLGGEYVLSAAPPGTGGGTTDLSVSYTAGAVTVASSTGADAVLGPAVAGVSAGIVTAADATRIAGAIQSETDPLYVVSPAAGISSTQITQWGTAYGWGDHGAEGYLTAETDAAALAAIGDLGPGDVGAEPAGVSAADITDATTAGRAVLTAADAAAQRDAIGTDAAGSARPPSAHAASHAAAGSDPITPADIGAATAAQGALAESAVQPGGLTDVIELPMSAVGAALSAGDTVPAWVPYPGTITAVHLTCSTAPSASAAVFDVVRAATWGAAASSVLAADISLGAGVTETTGTVTAGAVTAGDYLAGTVETADAGAAARGCILSIIITRAAP
jgi:hypothetical protein